MTARGADERWRPSLGLVVLAMLLTVAALPLLGLSFVRLYENQLVRQAEAELIGQGAVLAALVAREVGDDPAKNTLLGPVAPQAELAVIEPALDLTTDPVLARRPDAPAAPMQLPPAAAALTARLAPLLARVGATTLAGFRVVDRDGTVVAGGGEIGRSFAGIEEVADALQGRFRAVMRVRVSRHPPPPLYALSRGTSLRVFVAMPVLVEGRIAGAVYASRTPNNVVRLLYGERSKVGAALLAILAATLAIGLVFTRLIGRPIHALMARAAAIGRGERVPEDPVARSGTREFVGLARSLDAMARRLRERSDYVATFASHVSHELKTPLTAIQGAAELLRDDGDPGGGMTADERRRFLDNIVADTGRTAALLARLRELARAETVELRGSTTLDAVVAGIRQRFPQLTVRSDGDPRRAIGLSPENAGIVFAHLADNAVRHGATVLVIRAVAGDGTVRIRVADDGAGIAGEHRNHVFEPFFTTRREAGGTGMGLGIVRALLLGNGGSIEVAESNGGAAFDIALPSTPDPCRARGGVSQRGSRFVP